MSPLGFLAAFAAVALASSTQRITGIGFSLVSAPLLVLLAGPVQGVLLANLLSMGASLLILSQTWRQVELRRVALLAGPALAAIPVGLAVTRHVPPAPLMAGIGALVLAALMLVSALQRTGVFAGPGGAIAAGALSGFMNVTAGVGGPAVTLYAIGSRWPHTSFVGSVQLYFALVNAASVAAKGLPSQSAPVLLGLAAALVAGLFGGRALAPLVPPNRARTAVLVVAATGAAATLLKGVLASMG